MGGISNGRDIHDVANEVSLENQTVQCSIYILDVLILYE